MQITKTLTLLSIIASFAASVIYIFHTQKGINTTYDVIFYSLLLVPLSYGIITNQLNNRYTKYILPFIFIWLAKQKKISLDMKMLDSLSIDAKDYIDKSEMELP